MSPDIKILSILKDQVLAGLRVLDHLPLADIIKTPNLYQITNTQGWAVSIAKFHDYQCTVEIWVDKFAAHSENKIWYGLVWRKKTKKLDSLVLLLGSKFGIPHTLGPEDINESEDTYILLTKLENDKFGQPILEKHTHHAYYGIYEIDRPHLNDYSVKELALKIIDFICDIVEILSKDIIIVLNDYPNFENRKLVKQHLARERRTFLAIRRKRIDQYKCQICDFKFTEFYGNLARDYAEAHHIIPLGSSDEIRITNIEDLITVCANCHRMLHQMSGDATDISKLKDIVQKSRHLGDEKLPNSANIALPKAGR